TLLSSQTTDTPGTTHTHQRAQTRSGATFQTYPNHHRFANQYLNQFHDYNSNFPQIAAHEAPAVLGSI
ncbi:hypothetical protein, partial [Arthrobacter bambusae]|uniref:hypothetical protein n=1 Tax=Arthrobacter bambusae TaxID=1338426 RepID=UPI0027D7CE64